MMTRMLLVGLSLALALAACASPSDTSGAESDTSIPDTSIPVASVPDSVASPVELAKADLAGRIGTDEGIVVLVAEDVTWRDGALGCPQPGMSYTQALVDGYRIELSHGDTIYTYHGAVGRDPFLCDNGAEAGSTGTEDAAPSSTVAASEGSGTTMDDQSVSAYDGPLASLVAVAVADLATQRGVVPSQIAVVSAESVVWPDGSLGCPIPGMRYTQVQIEGAKIVLSLDGDVYTYHSGAGRDPFLCAPTSVSLDPDTGKPTTKLTLPVDPSTDPSTPTITLDPQD